MHVLQFGRLGGGVVDLCTLYFILCSVSVSMVRFAVSNLVNKTNPEAHQQKANVLIQFQTRSSSRKLESITIQAFSLTQTNKKEYIYITVIHHMSHNYTGYKIWFVVFYFLLFVITVVRMICPQFYGIKRKQWVTT